MKSLSFFAVLFAFSAIFNACDKNEPTPAKIPKEIELTTKSSEVIQSSNTFGVDLFVKVAADTDENLMLSPLSASAALTMALNGAEGETRTQIHQMLGYAAEMDLTEVNNAYLSLVSQLLNADKQVTLSIANALFYNLGFQVKEPFLNTLSTDFSAYTKQLDFTQPSALVTINKWAADNTNQKIPKVLEHITPQTVMFLMNALYFKGDWTNQFEKSNTTSQPFTLGNGNTIEVSTMNGKPGAITYFNEKYRVVELPYGRKNFSMVIIVPENNLKSFYNDFNPALWHHITSSLDNQNEWNETLISLPRFKFEFEKYLNDELFDLGMRDAFSSSLADFSKITDEQIFVSFVKQNTFVDVNEEGTEAAAVTTIGFERTSIPEPFMVNKPFIFAIRERTTNVLLFIGSVNDPSK
jgi:serpin B